MEISSRKEVILTTDNWIDVNDTLPEVDVFSYCHCFESFDQLARFTNTADYGDGEIVHLFENNHDQFVSVTHWMKAPEPPKKGQNNGDN